MPAIRAPDFHLGHTLGSGQIFRYSQEGDSFKVAHGDYAFAVRQKGDRLSYSGIDAASLRRFFSLDEDYGAILAAMREDRRMAPVVDSCRGLRIIKQDPWESMVAFVCSSQSNIPRIRNNLLSIASAYGKPLGDGAYSFPRPKEMKDTSLLKGAKLGYREAYVAGLVKAVDERALRRLEMMDYPSAREYLLSLTGIGEKVAECILLFGLGHREAFPVDVWVDRGMKRLFGLDEKLSPKHLQAVGQQYFGEHAGYAQQFIFHHARTNKHLFTPIAQAP